MSAGDLTPDTWSPAPVDPDSEGWYGTKHDPRFPMIHSAQSVIDDLDDKFSSRGSDGNPG